MSERVTPEDAAKRFEAFGRAVWRLRADDFWCSEDGWTIAEAAVDAGLAERVKFDPAIHSAEDAEPGDEIIWPIL